MKGPETGRQANEIPVDESGHTDGLPDLDLDKAQVASRMPGAEAAIIYFTNPATGEKTDIGPDGKPLLLEEPGPQPQSHEEGEQ